MYTPSIFWMGMYDSTPYHLFGNSLFNPGTTIVNDEYRTAFKWALGEYWNHLTPVQQSKTWLYLWDEPFYIQEVGDNLEALSKLVQEVGDDIQSKIPIYISARFYDDMLADNIDIYGVTPQGDWMNKDEMEKLQGMGKDLIYTMDGQYCLDTPYYGMERITPFYCYKFGVIGMESWGVDDIPSYNQFKWPWHWPDREWGQRMQNGDGFLFYLGYYKDKMTLTSTTRLEQIREGIEDYEYVHIIDTFKESGIGTAAQNTEAQNLLDEISALAVFPNKHGNFSTSYISDPDYILDLRRKMGEFIAGLQ